MSTRNKISILAQTGAKMLAIFLSRLIGWSVFGLLLNAALLFGASVLIQDGKTSATLLQIVLLACISAWIVVGQSQGMASALDLLARKHMGHLLQYLLHRMPLPQADSIQLRHAPGSAEAQAQAQAQMQALQACLHSPELPRLIRLSAGKFEDSRLAAALLQAWREYEPGADNLPQNVEKLANIAACHIPPDSFAPDWLMPGGMLLLNLALVGFLLWGV
ncbi:hypothetical protein V8J88_10180 [Massilia sp. W12]|uniref:hypothetical protein n=1 Tax=Massilia sp. W12 TaxID=3126507 RepID=UPI0030D1CD41